MRRKPHPEDLDEDIEALLGNTAAIRALTQRGVDVAGSIAALARRLGLAASHISRMRRGQVGMGVETCLVLAEVLDEDPFPILHRCGFATLADRLERLRQPDAKVRRAGLHDALERLPWRDRQIISGLIDRLLVDARADMPDADPPRKRGTR
jgi:transcriptional regulator with XRE-family HTH domain